MKTLFCIVGRTASGKDSLTSSVIDELNLKQVISYTTRPKRINEENTHIFIEEKEFENYKNDIVAYTEINGYKYFCTKEQLLESDIYIIDPNGVDYLKKQNLGLKLITIYVNVDYDTRYQRAINNRKDDVEVFIKRNLSENAQFENFEKNRLYDYMVTNLDFESSKKELKEIIFSERNKK